MQLTLNDEQQELRRTVRSFLERKSPEPVVRQVMASATGWDAELWQGMADQGLLGLAVPEALGGGGYGYTDLAVVAEETGRVLAPVPLLASIGLGAEILLRSGDRNAQEEWLPRIACGEIVTTLALLEDQHDWSATGVHATATRDGDGWVIDGAKRFVLAGDFAHLILVAARTDAGISVFAVDAGAPGVARRPLETLDQTRRLSDVTFTGAAARLVGDDGGGWPVVEAALRAATVLLAAEQVGGASRVLEMAVDYAKTRIQFGRPIGSFQAIKHTCADMLAGVETARATASYAAWALDAGDADLAVAVGVAKAKCSQTFVTVANDNVQIHGGIGFTWEHPAHLYVKRARSTDVLFGTSADHRRALADRLGL